MPLYRFVHLVEPLPTHPEASIVGGAYALCLVKAKTAGQALRRAKANFDDHQYHVLGLEEEPRVVVRDDYLANETLLEAVDSALQSGEVYVYHKWPIEAADKNS